MPKCLPATAGVSRFPVGALLRKTVVLGLASIAVIAAAPASSRADAVGAAFGAGTGLVVAGPPGAIVGGVVGAVWGHPFWALQTVRTLVGSIIPFIGTADITADDGIAIEQARAVIHTSLPQ